MKFNKKYFNVTHWLAVLRRQPAHMQHFYALVFSGVVTALLGAAILYFDYGFWREKYSRSEGARTTISKKKNTPELVTASPKGMIDSFFNEASVRIQTIKDSKPNFLESKDVYTKEEASATTTEHIDQPKN